MFRHIFPLRRFFLLRWQWLNFFILLSISSSGLATELERIGYASMPGNKLQINLNFSQSPPTPISFSTDNPARIVLDFPYVMLGLDKKTQTIGVGAVQGARAVQTNDRTRVVLNLVGTAPFDISTQDRRVLVTVDNIVQSSNSVQREDPLTQASLASGRRSTAPGYAGYDDRPSYDDSPSYDSRPSYDARSSYADRPTDNDSPGYTDSRSYDDQPAYDDRRYQDPGYGAPSYTPSYQDSRSYDSNNRRTARYQSQGPHISNIDFRRTAQDAGRIIITLSTPDIVVDMQEQAGEIILNFPDTGLPERLDRRLDVIDFATPITFIDTSMQGGDVQMRITVTGNYEHLAYQSGETYVVEVKEREEEETPQELRRKPPSYSGQKVSFNFQNIDIRAALLLLTDLPGVNLNMVASENVTGTITLRLKNVPWDQALDIILESNGLGMKKVGNVIMIDRKDLIAKREQKELEAQKKIKELEPLHTEFIQINYAKAEDFKTLLRHVGGNTEQHHSFLSKRGNVSMDERTNTLIVQDTVSRLEDIRRLITALDVPVRQVLIESRVVIAEDTFSRALGVKFGYSGNQDLGEGNGVVVGGKVAGNTTFSNTTGFSSENTLVGDGEGENFIISLPETLGSAQNAALGLAIGKIGSYLLQLELSALQQEGRGEIVASPRVITANQKTATIYQGQQRAYRAAAGVGAVAEAQFKDAFLKLEVTPQITPDDRVIMELVVDKDDFLPSPAGGEPPVSKRQVKTQVLVDNGETVVLGGVYEQNRRNEIERVPFLSDIPILGNLFKRRKKEDTKSELLIFVTPKILKET